MLRCIVSLWLVMGLFFSALAGESEECVMEVLLRAVQNNKAITPTVKAKCDSMWKSSEGELNFTDLLKLELEINQDLMSGNKPTDVIKLSMATLPIVSDNIGKDKEEVRQYIYLLNQLGTIAKGHGAYSLIFNYYINGYEIARRFGMQEEKALLLNNIGTMYTDIKNYPKAIASFKEAIEINEKLKLADRLFVNYNNLSAAYAYVKDFDKSLEYAFLAMHQLKSPQQDEMKMLMQRNICGIYSKKGMYDFALEKMQEVLAYQQSHNNDRYLGDSYRIVGDIYGNLNNQKRAISYYKKALEYAKKYNNAPQRAELLKSSSEALMKIGDAPTAFAMLKECNTLKDSLANIDNTNQLNLLLDLYTSTQKQYAVSNPSYIGDSKAEWKFYGSVFLICILALILATVVLIYHRKKKGTTTRRAIMPQITDKNEIISPDDNDKISHLENEVKQYEAKILTLSLQQQYDNDFREQLSENLKHLLLKINPKSTALKSEINDVIIQINHYGSNSELNLFNDIFEKIHPSFYSNLTKQYDNLTPKELRLCAMLRLGFSSKSIASITFRETRSVESARNRLRKKFNLQQQDDLTTFLMHF